MISCGIFNQYYYDLLKKIRDIAKKHKDHSSTSKKIIEISKENYQTFDKSSSEYLDFFKLSCNDEFWKSYLELSKEDCDDWLKKDDIKCVEIFKKITIGDIAKVLRDNFLCHHYLTVFYIFKNDLDDDEASKILKILQSFDVEFELDNADFKTVINRLNSLKTEKVKSDATNDAMDDLKDTTIGKIAKEIIDDVDITKLKKSIAEEGDIFKALANPENGLGELFTNVGNKVTNKISSGELNQEAIMKDAMKFASLLPSMFGNSGAGGDGGDAGGLNMADMMKMMSAMNSMGGMGGMGGKNQKTGVNKQGLRNLAKRAELKKKLSKKSDA
jgi:hypothetical protein